MNISRDQFSANIRRSLLDYTKEIKTQIDRHEKHIEKFNDPISLDYHSKELNNLKELNLKICDFMTDIY